MKQGPSLLQSTRSLTPHHPLPLFILCCHLFLKQQTQTKAVTASILLTRTPGPKKAGGAAQDHACVATVIVRDEAGKPVPGAIVAYKWTPASPTSSSAAGSRTVSGQSGRLTASTSVAASAKACTLQLQSVTLPGGVAAALADASRAPKTITWV